MANPDILITPGQGTIGFSGTNTGTIQLRVAESGDIHFEGDQGSLLSLSDDLSDSLFSVNDAAGMPVFEVFADDTIKAYRNNEAKLEIDPDNNRIRLRDNAFISGDSTVSGESTVLGSLYLERRAYHRGDHSTFIDFTPGQIDFETSSTNGIRLRNNTFISGNLTVSGDITSASASHEATSYTASTHVSGISGYFGKVGIGTTQMSANTKLVVENGNVGIGTTTPSDLLHVYTSATLFQSWGNNSIIRANTGGDGLRIYNNDSAGTSLVVGQGGTAPNARNFVVLGGITPRVGVGDYTDTNMQATFNVSGDTSITGELRTDNLYAGGIAGIGIAPSSHRLEVAGGSYNSNLKLKGGGASAGILFADSDNNTDGYVYSAGQNIGFLDAGADWMVRCVDDQFISFSTDGGTEHMRVNSAGKVGIGTSNPAELLTISGANATVRINSPTTAGSDTAAYTFGFNANADLAGMRLDHSDRVVSGLSLFVHPLYGYPISLTPATDKHILLNLLGDDSKVGIGTTNPAARLHITSNGSHDEGAEIALRHDNNNSTDVVSTISFQNNAGQVAKIAGETVGANNNGVITFHTDDAGTSTEAMRIDSSQNVGIGTTNPDSALHIYKTAPIISLTDSNSFSDSDDRFIFRAGTPDGGFFQWYDDSASTTTNLMFIGADGKVGIGTTDPQGVDLHVNGSTIVSGTLFVKNDQIWYDANSTDVIAKLHDNNDDGVFDIYQNNSVINRIHGNGASYFKGGNVGIGTDNPARKFMVHGGSARMGIKNSTEGVVLGLLSDDAGYFQLNSADGTSQILLRADAGDSYITGQLGIGTQSPNSALEVFGQVRILDSTALPSYGARLVVGRDTAQCLKFTVDDTLCTITADQDSDSNGNHRFILDRTFDGNGENTFEVRKDGTRQLLIDTDGKVGIGTAEPTGKLHIYQSGDSQPAFLVEGSQGSLFSVEDTLTGSLMSVNDIAGLPVFEAFDDGTIVMGQYNSGDLVVTGNKVGIGTTSPDKLLTVESTTSPIIGLYSTYSDSNARNWAIATNNTAYGDFTLSNSAAKGGNPNVVKVTILKDGNVGIGTTSPDYLLDIGGDTSQTSHTIRMRQGDGGTAIRIGAGGGGNDVTLLRIDGESTNSLGESDAGQYGFSIRYMGSRSANANSFSIFSDNQNAGSQVEAFTMFQDGSIGIGETSPEGLLSFKADESNTPKIRFQNQHSVTTDAAVSTYDDANGTTILIGSNLYIASDGSTNRFNTSEESAGFRADRGGLLQFYAGEAGATASERIRVTADGNIGIGTTNPDTQLDLSQSVDGPLAINIHNQSTNAAADSAISFETQGATDFTIGIDRSLGTFSMCRNATLGTNEIVRIDPAGTISAPTVTIDADVRRVGIGTASPAQVLHVSGNIRVGGGDDYNRIEFNRFGPGSATIVGGIGFHSDANFYMGGHPSVGPTAGNKVFAYGFGNDIHIGDNTNGPILTVKDNGKVAIGQSAAFTAQADTPQALLTVSGDASITGELRTDGRVGLGGVAPANSRGSFSDVVIGDPTSDNAQVEWYEANSSAAWSLYDNDRFSIWTNKSSSWQERFSINLTNGSTNVTGDLKVAGDVIMGTGRSPLAALEVVSEDDVTMKVHRPNSDLGYNDTVGIGFSQRADYNSPSSDTRAGIFSVHNGDLILAAETAGNISTDPADHSRLWIDGNNGEVLIGEGRGHAGALLTVSGDASITGQLRTNSNCTFGGNISVPAGNIFYLDGGSNSYIYQDSSDSISLATNSVIRWTADNNEFSVNDDSVDMDFRVESNNKTHMLFVEGATDRVAIGHDDPLELLDIVSNDGTDHTDDTPDTLLRLRKTFLSSADKDSAVNFDVSRYIAGGNNRPRTRLDFVLAGDEDDTYDNREPNVNVLSIRSDRKVGIGTTNPDTQLDLSQSVDGPLAINIHNQSTNAAADSAISFETQGATDFTIGIDRSLGTFSMCRNATLGTNEIVRIDPAGTISAPTVTIDADVQKVGIGTTSPGHILEVYSAAPVINIKDGGAYRLNATPYLQFSDYNNYISRIGKLDNSNSVGLDLQTNSGHIHLNPAENVGIGQSSPSGKLHITTSSVAGVTPSTSLDDLIVENNGAGGITLINRNDAAAGIAFADDDQAVAGLISYNHNGNSLRFTTNGNTEAMRIDSSQRVGIGTSAPDRYLHVHSGSAGSVTALSNSTAVLESSSHAALEFLSPNAKNSIIYMREVGGAYGYINYVHSTPAMNFSVGGGANMITLDAAGHVGIGEETPEATLQVDGDASITGDLSVTRFIKHGGDEDTKIDFGSTEIDLFANNVKGISVKTTEVAINDNSADVNFRVESDSNSTMLFVDGGTNRVSIGHSSAEGTFDVNGDAIVRGNLYFDGVSSSYIDNVSHDLQLKGAAGVSLWTHVSAGWTERLTVTDPGDVGIGITVPSGRLHVENNSTGIIVANDQITGSAFEVFGAQGNLLTVTDDLSDSLFSVNDAAGMPVFEVFADDTIKSYRNNESKFEVDPDNNRIRLRDNVNISGLTTITGGAVVGGGTRFTAGGTHELSINLGVGDCIGIGASDSALNYFRRYSAINETLQLQTYAGANNGIFSMQPYGGEVHIGTNNGTATLGSLLAVDGDVQISGHIRAGADGKDGMRMGHWEPADGYGYLQNEALDPSNGDNYAVLQSNNGDTYINAADGRTLFLRVENATEYDSEFTASGVLWNRGGLPNADFAVKGDSNNVFKVDAGDEYLDLQTAKLKIAGTGSAGKFLKSEGTDGSVSFETVQWNHLPAISTLDAI